MIPCVQSGEKLAAGSNSVGAARPDKEHEKSRERVLRAKWRGQFSIHQSRHSRSFAGNRRRKARWRGWIAEIYCSRCLAQRTPREGNFGFLWCEDWYWGSALNRRLFRRPATICTPVFARIFSLWFHQRFANCHLKEHCLSAKDRKGGRSRWKREMESFSSSRRDSIYSGSFSGIYRVSFLEKHVNR